MARGRIGNYLRASRAEAVRCVRRVRRGSRLERTENRSRSSTSWPVREETTVRDLRLIPLIRKPAGIFRFPIILVVLVMMIAMIGLTGGLVP